MQSLLSWLVEDDKATLLAVWAALEALCKTITRELAPAYVRSAKDAVGTARGPAEAQEAAWAGGCAGVLPAQGPGPYSAHLPAGPASGDSFGIELPDHACFILGVQFCPFTCKACSR